MTIFFEYILLWSADPPFISQGFPLDSWSFGTLVNHDFVVSLKVCSLHLKKLITLLNNIFIFIADCDGISSLDSSILDLDCAICIWIYWSHFPLLCLQCVSWLIPTRNLVENNFCFSDLIVTQ